jgi:predicted nucleic acid-binding protein
LVVYADTSFLVSLYAQDANSAEARDLVSGLTTPFAFTPLHAHEARNAVRLAVFRKEINAEQCTAVLTAMETDEQTGVLSKLAVSWAEVFDQAEAMSAMHTAALGTRAMDVLHVAAATVLAAKEFLTFDDRQKALAVQAGLKVRPKFID